MQKTSHRGNLRLIGPATVIGLAGGCLLGIALTVYFTADVGWQQVANPPDKAAEILGYYYMGETVYIRTTAGNIYACSSSTGRTKSKECTRLTQVPPESNNNISCGWKRSPTPKPPGIFVHEFEAHPCVPDSTVQVNHIILEDGSIWKWEKWTTELDDFFKAIFVGICGIVGTILGLIGGVLILLLKKKQQLQAA